MSVPVMAPGTTIFYFLFIFDLTRPSVLKTSNHTFSPSGNQSLLNPINLYNEQSAGSQSQPLKFEHALTLGLQLSNVP